MRFVLRLAFFLSIACLVANAQPSAKIGPSAVWQIPAQFLTTAHAACDPAATHGIEECLMNQMQKAGAPADAVRFTRLLYKESHGEFGVMTGFHDQGPVAFAWITYPLRANTNYGFLILNGQPRIINVEDLKLLDSKTMKQDPQFLNLKAQFPKIDVWPGDRSGQIWPNSQTGPNGGQQFSIGYPLKNGCNACASAGQVIFNWNFDSTGKFQGTSFQGIIGPPPQ
jgi:hypothetical protein